MYILTLNYPPYLRNQHNHSCSCQVVTDTSCQALCQDLNHVSLTIWTSLVTQWFAFNSPSMQGTWVQLLVQEDPTCCRATKPEHLKC